MTSGEANMTHLPTILEKNREDNCDEVATSIVSSQKGTSRNLMELEEHILWPVLRNVPISLEVAVPIIRFCVRDLLALEDEKVIQSAWQSTTDIPLCIGKVHLSWGEFEVSEGKLALRLTLLT